MGDGQEGFFQLPWKLPLGEQRSERLLCISKERQGGIFFSFFSLNAPLGSSRLTHSGQVHVLAEKGRREGACNGDDLHGAFSTPLTAEPQNPATASGSRINLPLSHPSTISVGYNLHLFPSKTPADLGTPKEGSPPPFLGGMSCSDNLGSSKIPGKARAVSHQPDHGTRTERLEGTISALTDFWEDRMENANFCVKEELKIIIILILPETRTAVFLQLEAMMILLRHLPLGHARKH